MQLYICSQLLQRQPWLSKTFTSKLTHPNQVCSCVPVTVMHNKIYDLRKKLHKLKLYNPKQIQRDPSLSNCF